MSEKAKKYQVTFRPHFKTHQSAEIGSWFKEQGVSKITVSSVQMAEYFTNAGWKDILIAFPVNLLEIDHINQLAKKVRLHLMVESVETTKFLINNLKYNVGIYLKIDTGYHRTGLRYKDDNEIINIVTLINNSEILNFTGILTHSGHSYHSNSTKEILDIYNKSVEQLLLIKQKISTLAPDCIISVGDTPTCSLIPEFNDIDEVRPGNFVFYDVMQYYLGACNLNQITIALACPVVAKHKNRNEIVVYGGAVHLSKEFILDNNKQKIFGLISKQYQKGWDIPLSDTYVSSLSQEHGIIKTTREHFDKFKIGEIVCILPIHSCLTANLMSQYQTFEGSEISKFKYSK